MPGATSGKSILSPKGYRIVSLNMKDWTGLVTFWDSACDPTSTISFPFYIVTCKNQWLFSWTILSIGRHQHLFNHIKILFLHCHFLTYLKISVSIEIESNHFLPPIVSSNPSQVSSLKTVQYNIKVDNLFIIVTYFYSTNRATYFL